MKATRLGFLALLIAVPALAQTETVTTVIPGSPQTMAVEFKLGGYKPQIDSEAGLSSEPYNSVFGASAMLLGEIEFDRELWRGFGTASLGFSVGYAEKFGTATVVDDDGSIESSSENTGLFVLPLRLMAIYRFDWAATKFGIPLVPYAKLALIYEPWWTTKGGEVDYVDGQRGAGGKWGYGFTGGLSFLLDVLEPRLARDFDVDMGVNHTYVFGEFTYANVNNFGGAGLDLSSRHFTFGLMFEF